MLASMGAMAEHRTRTTYPGDFPIMSTELLAEFTESLMVLRQQTGPRHLAAPGPSPELLRRLFAGVAAAPDHGQLRPWRFVVIGEAARAQLGEVFAAALLERDPSASAEEQATAREKAQRAPTLILAVADLRHHDPKVSEAERLVSLGCAIQNLLLGAVAHGFAAGLSSGRALGSQRLRYAYGIAEGEQAVCFISIGTAARVRPSKIRPEVDEFVRWV